MVPVLDKNKKPLMPCSEKRARKLMERGEAKPYWCKGVFCIILQRDPKSRHTQDVVVGIDPGSRMSGFTVKSTAVTFMNIQAMMPDWIKDKLSTRREIRRLRRKRKGSYKKRYPKSRKPFLSPQIKARWQFNLKVINTMTKLFPINYIAVEDCYAKKPKWSKPLAPIQIGKRFFYQELEKLSIPVYKFQGYQTAEMRKHYGLKKSTKKLKVIFDAHCVDSWCLANEIVGGHTKPDNERVLYIQPMKFHRRQLHLFKPQKGGKRRRHGSTRSLGLNKGCLVRHSTKGLALVGGNMNGKISLHDIKTNRRVFKYAKLEDLEVLTNLRLIISNGLG